MKITETMLLNDIFDLHPELANIFSRHGLNCIGCAGANSETLREAAEGHGINLAKLLEDLNQFYRTSSDRKGQG